MRLHTVRRLLKNSWLLVNRAPSNQQTWNHKTFSVFCFITKKQLSAPLLSDQDNNRIQNLISEGAIQRKYSTSWQERFTIFNPEYDKYLESLQNELMELQENNSSDTRQFCKATNKRLKELSIIVNSVEVLREKASELKELSVIQNSNEDKEMEKMIVEDKETCLEEIRQLELQLVNHLVGKQSTDNNDIILEVTAGVGGQEAMLFTAEIFDMYEYYSAYKGWLHQVLSCEHTEQGGVRRASMEISGRDVFKYFKYEGGVHRVQRIPQTEKGGRVHTSTMSVAVLAQPSEIDVVINAKDLRIETFRASGAGGQHVNTTDSAVRLIHIPTGTMAECQQERSQIKNKEKALQIVRSRIYQKQLESQLSEQTTARKIQVGTGGRSEKIRTYNFNQDRITDHRISQNLYNLHDFFSGSQSLDNLIHNLMTETKYKTMEALMMEYSERFTQKKQKKR